MKFPDWKLLKLLGLSCKMEEDNLKDSFDAEVIDVFPFPGGEGFIVSFNVGANRPLVGNYVEFSRGEIWRVDGIMLAGIDKSGNEILEKQRNFGKWDLYLKPIHSTIIKPIKGKAIFSRKLPPSIVKNQN